jgi:phosphoribosylformylglycinamidine synthase
VDLDLAPRVAGAVARAVGAGVVRSCHDLSEGGLAVAAAEMAFAGELGLEVSLDAVPRENDLGDAALLYSESNSRFLVEVEPGREADLAKALGDVPSAAVGRVLPKPVLTIVGTRGAPVVEAKVGELATAWRTGINL